MPTITATPPITAATFRSDYPEFVSPQIYPDSMVNYWLAVGTLMLNPDRWGTLFNLGLELFVAHNLVLEQEAQATAQAGGWPGVSKGIVSSESPGAVTISYDTANAVEENASHWNLTTYGIRFLRTARMMGAGPIQIGPCGSLGGAVPGFPTGVFGMWYW